MDEEAFAAGKATVPPIGRGSDTAIALLTYRKAMERMIGIQIET